MKTMKENLKALFDFVKEYTKIKTFTATPIEGFEVKVDYVYYLTPAWDAYYEILNTKIKISKELKAFEKFLNTSFVRTFDEEASENVIPAKEFNKISDQFDKLRLVFDGDFLNDMGDISTFKNFTECWKETEKYLAEKEKPSKVVFKINNAYNATIEKGAKNIQVGCQTIPIDSIKSLLSEIEKLNT